MIKENEIIVIQVQFSRENDLFINKYLIVSSTFFLMLGTDKARKTDVRNR